MTINEWISTLILEKQKQGSWNRAFEATSRVYAPVNYARIATALDSLETRSGFHSKQQELLEVLLSTYDPDQTLQQFLVFLNVGEKQSGFAWNFTHPELPALLTIFGRSEFLTRYLVKYPQWAEKILNSSRLRQMKSRAEMEQELGDLLAAEGALDVHRLKTLLRQYKYSEYLRITVRDLAELCPFEETLAELTSVACCCVKYALLASLPFARGTETIDFQSLLNNPEWPFFVLGMGKMGGNELNYSSDIDLIFLYDPEQVPEDVLEKETLRQKVARTMISIMSDVTEDGFVCRVDMRLRPGGEQSPLVASMYSAEVYYQVKGELWERQALIKASVIAGPGGEDFLQMMSPFIFSRLIDENLLHEVESVKHRIEKEHLRENHLNVKLGVGGIREIEFFVQTFQMLYAGPNAVLRKSNTLEALQQLGLRKMVSERDVQTLRESYLFLRKVEHRLQLWEEFQTHTVPADVTQQNRLARILKYPHSDIEVSRRFLLQDLKDVMSKVRSIFGGLFSKKHVEIEAAIRNSTKFRNFPEDIARTIDSMATQLAPILQSSEQSLLETRFQRLFEHIGPRIYLYEHLVNHPSSLERLAVIAETSEFLWNYLLNHLDLLKLLEQQNWAYTRDIWTREMEEIVRDKEDEEAQLDRLRDYKHTMTFLVGSAELDGLLSYDQARKRLNHLGEVILQAAFMMASDYVKSRYGEPFNEQGEPTRLAILGLGKFGGMELTYLSDLDLVFIYSEYGMTNGATSISAQAYYVKLIQRLITIMSTFTRSGFAYQLDTRLRPSGNAGVLVTPLSAFLKYHQTSAPWEHQAMLRARPVAGDLAHEPWKKAVENSIHQAITEWTPPEDLRRQINHMRYRKQEELAGETDQKMNLKEGFGGLLDVEYMTQYLQLLHGPRHPALYTNSTLDALEKMSAFGVMDESTAQTLLGCYRMLRQIESYLRLLYDKSTNTLDFKSLETEPLLQLLQRQGHEISDFQQAYRETTRKVRGIYEQFMGNLVG
ncbi:MAG: hypothetical protein HQM11_15335 [SAR324 cluster bacterium]|nr:hypothetical protein [SAR324 cluster bacterium]